jgi:hypothetical protein
VNSTLVKRLAEREDLFLKSHQEFPVLYSVVCEVLADMAVNAARQHSPTSQQISNLCTWLQNFTVTSRYAKQPIPKVCLLLVKIFCFAANLCKGALSHALVQLPKECKVLWALKHSFKNITNEVAYIDQFSLYNEVLEEVHFVFEA